jgi:cell division transport system permease protein
MLTTPSRILRTSLQQMRRHGWQTVAALSVISLTFFVISLFVLVGLGSNVVLSFFEKQPQMSVYFKDGVSPDRIKEMQKAFEDSGKVASIHYTSKDEALAFYQQSNKNQPDLIQNVAANVLPASIDIQPKKLSDISSLATLAHSGTYKDIVEEVDYEKDLTSKLSSWTSAGRLIGLGLIGFLTVVSFLIMLVIIGMNISSYQQEIQVMRLVGASNWYIRGPFVLEGVLYGVFAAILSVGIVYLSLPWLAPSLEYWFKGINIFPIPIIPVFGGMLLFEVILGALLGIIGATVAMRRSLKV